MTGEGRGELRGGRGGVLAGLFAAALLSGPGGATAAGGPARLEVLGGGGPDAWVARGEVPAFGFGIAPAEILARLPAPDGPPAEMDYRDFAAWAVPRGITLVRSHPPFVATGAGEADLLLRGPDGRFDPERFNDEYFARLRTACERFRDVGILVQLRIWDAADWRSAWSDCVYHPDRLAAVPWSEAAGPGRFVVDPETAPGLVAHQREHLRRVLDATGDLGNVFYELAAGIGDGYGESEAWVEAMLDEVEAWEGGHGSVLVGMEDDGTDRAGAGHPASNPRLDVVFADPSRPERHAAIREAHGKPTFAGEVRGLAGENDPALSATAAVEARRILWRMFVTRCQAACVATEWGASGYRMGPLDTMTPATLPGEELSDLRSIYAPADLGAERILDPGAADARLLLLPRRDWFAPHREPARGWLLLEGDPARAGEEHPAATVQLRGLSYLAPEDPHDIAARLIHLDTGEVETRPLRFRVDDLRIEVPAFRGALVAFLRQRPAPDFFQYVQPPYGMNPDVAVRAIIEGQSVRLDWDGNPAPPEWDTCVAWVQRLPDDEWLACTPGTTFTDPAPKPGKNVYMLAWRKVPRERGAVRGTRVTVADVPDTAPGAPEIVTLRADDDATVLWARSAPAADLAGREWQRRNGGSAWEAVPGSDGAVLRDPAAPPETEYRVRVLDAAGNAGPFSDPARARP